MSTAYSIHVVPDETSEGSKCYVAYHPELEGCMSHGATVPEAIQGLDDARDLYLKTLNELGQEIPPPPEVPSTVVWESFSTPRMTPGPSRPAHSLPVTELTASR